MPKLTIRAATTVSPKQFLASLTDFSSERAGVWHNSQPNYLKIHSRGKDWIDVTEGSDIFGGVWERLHYDWSQPNQIVIKTLDGNLWNDKSGWSYVLTPHGSGTTVSYTITRFSRNLKGQLIIIFLGVFGRVIITRDFKQTLRRIEKKLG